MLGKNKQTKNKVQRNTETVRQDVEVDIFWLQFLSQPCLGHAPLFLSSVFCCLPFFFFLVFCSPLFGYLVRVRFAPSLTSPRPAAATVLHSDSRSSLTKQGQKEREGNDGQPAPCSALLMEGLFYRSSAVKPEAQGSLT